ncbi:MAG: carbohydrate ABC transporter permease [Chloroflexi bacterium]|nr:carbohydrate ABC transporter permease [Chloroflexota bacterium]
MASLVKSQPTPKSYVSAPAYAKQLKRFTSVSMVTLFALILLSAFLMPFIYGSLTAFKDKEQIIRSAKGSILPMDPVQITYPTYTYNDQELDVYEVTIGGEPQQWALVEQNETTGQAIYVNTVQPENSITLTGKTAVIGSETIENVNPKLLTAKLDLYEVSIDGTTRTLALYKPGRQSSTFIDPDDPSAEPITWEGKWRTLTAKMEFAPRTGNFKEAWDGIDFPLLFRNTLIVALLGMTGTLLSSICVAYAFARFPIPGKRIIFLILVGTIILPRQVTLVPTYTFFARIHWTGTWLPLIVPHFFANAYNVFLLRQYFLTLPREMDEAAMIDGAGPFRVLYSIIIPQSWPAIVAVGLFHFVYAWNDYFEPLIYLLGKPELHTITVGIQRFNFIYDQQPHLIQATALLGLTLPVILFFLAQRVFMQGVVVTGVEK